MRLRTRRLARGLSQRDLAAAAGLTRQAIGALESGRTQPSLAVALALADLLDARVEELFGAPDTADDVPARAPAGPRASAVARIGERVVSRALDPGRVAALGSAGCEETLFVAGCDVALELLADALTAGGRYRALCFTASNRGALAQLRDGRAHAASLHLAGGEPLPAEELDGCALFALGETEEGWLVGGGAARPLREPRRLVRSEVRIANRPRGSAARALLDAELKAAGRDPATVAGYRRELPGQLDVARAVASGYADAAIGMRAAAALFGLAFLPLRRERSLLAVPRRHLARPPVAALVATLRGARFAASLAALDAYETATTGVELAAG